MQEIILVRPQHLISITILYDFTHIIFLYAYYNIDYLDINVSHKYNN